MMILIFGVFIVDFIILFFFKVFICIKEYFYGMVIFNNFILENLFSDNFKINI
jgi:hypothetical protein